MTNVKAGSGSWRIKVDEFVKFMANKRCDQCKMGKPLLVNSEGFYSHSEDGNYCVNHPLFKHYEDWKTAK